MQDDSMTPQTQIRLMKEFPQINTDVAKEIDIKIKTKILAYESDTVNRDMDCSYCLDFFWVYVAYIFVVQKRKNIYAYIIKKQIILRKIIR